MPTLKNYPHGAKGAGGGDGARAAPGSQPHRCGIEPVPQALGANTESVRNSVDLPQTYAEPMGRTSDERKRLFELER